MVKRDEVDRLCQRDPMPAHPVLSVYLDVDQSHAVNLNRGFVAALRAQLHTLEPRVPEAEREAFAAARAHVEQHVTDYQPRAKTLVLYTGGDPELWWSGELAAPLASDLRWAPVPYVRPLLEAFDHHRRHVVVAVSKERARLLSVFLGEVETEREAIAAADVHHKQASGTDHLRSQMHFQRQDEGHVRWHLQHVVGLLDDMSRERPFDWLVLAGPPETTSELAALLPHPLAERLAGAVRVPFDAPASVLATAGLPVIEGAEQQSDEQHVARVLDGGAYGLEATLASLHEGRAQMLVYAVGFTAPGAECLRCHGLFSAEAGAVCPYDGEPLLLYDDVVDRAVARATTLAATIQPIRGDPAARLVGSGGIGVVARF